jgi:transposase
MDTPKLKYIMQLAKQGKTVKEIAVIFNKSIPTINRYIALLRKERYPVLIIKGRPRIKVD